MNIENEYKAIYELNTKSPLFAKIASDLINSGEIEKAITEIKKTKAKTVMIQLPDGLKPKAKEIVDELKQKTKNVKFYIWAGSCYGACDIPETGNKTPILIVPSHQTADTTGSTDCTCRIAISQVILIHSHQTTDTVFSSNRTGRIAVSYVINICPPLNFVHSHQPADTIGSYDRASRIAVSQVTMVPSNQPAYIVIAININISVNNM